MMTLLQLIVFALMFVATLALIFGVLLTSHVSRMIERKRVWRLD